MEAKLFAVAFVVYLGWIFIRQIQAMACQGLHKRIPITAAMCVSFILTQNYGLGAWYQLLVSIYTFLVYIENVKLLFSDRTE